MTLSFPPCFKKLFGVLLYMLFTQPTKCLNLNFRNGEMSFGLKSLFIPEKKSKSMKYLTSKDFFFGKINRQRAEEVLQESGGEDGRFLLRECLSFPKNFSLAVCFNGKPYHYQLKFQTDGTIRMAHGASFSNADKMISHFSTRANGLITKLTHPCQRDVFGGAQVWPSISESKALLYLTEAGKKTSNFEEVIRQVYRLQPWYKGGMTREESRKYLLNRRNGEFVIREKENGFLVLSLMYEKKDYHYVVETKKSRKTGLNSYKINPGPEFDNIMELVTFYHNGGLACPLHIDYEASKATTAWLKSNPAHNVHKSYALVDNKEMDRCQQLNRFSKSLESLDISPSIWSDEDDTLENSEHSVLQNYSLVDEVTFKCNDKAIFEPPKSEKMQVIRRLNPPHQHGAECDQTNDEKQKKASPNTNRFMMEPAWNQLYRKINPTISQNEKQLKKPPTKMTMQQNSAPAGHDLARTRLSSDNLDFNPRPKFPSETEYYKISNEKSNVRSPNNQKPLLPPKSHISKSGRQFQFLTSYELEEAFIAMIKKEALHQGKKIPLSNRRKANFKNILGVPDIPENLPRISRNQLCFSSTIGKGHFGIVHEAIFNGCTKVAVKTSLHGPHRVLSEFEFMKEAHLMSFMDHENVIKLLGICRSSESLILVLELANLGNLKSFLSKNRKIPEHQIILALRQICDGMCYLESKAIVHRDLAARNVLLFEDWVAKISDFGLSRSMNEMSHYEFTGEKELPLRWYPPEVFNDAKFSHKSDVWSFGVTTWEGLTYGSDPYQGLQCKEYIEYINSGKRLQRPSKCSDGIYQVMHMCWQTREGNRPTFEELKSYLETSYLTIIKP